MRWRLVALVLKYFIFFVVIAAVSAAVYVYYEFKVALVIARGNQQTYLVRAGDPLGQVAKGLANAQIIHHPWIFNRIGHELKLNLHLRAGRYVFVGPLSEYGILQTLARGKTIPGKIRINEGKTFADLMRTVNQSTLLTHHLQHLSRAEIMQRIGHAGEDPEGRFFPDTYFFEEGDSDIHFLQRAYTKMSNQLKAAWAGRDPNVPYTDPREALIMASLIEKESGYGPERARIAGVFVHRLRINMLLQCDSTVIYGMGQSYQGKLSHADVHRPTPYNTYVNKGLPPTPIALPSVSALHAALHPAETDAIYFVVKGDGSHVFSATLAEHNRAVNAYRSRVAEQRALNSTQISETMLPLFAECMIIFSSDLGSNVGCIPLRNCFEIATAFCG